MNKYLFLFADNSIKLTDIFYCPSTDCVVFIRDGFECYKFLCEISVEKKGE